MEQILTDYAYTVDPTGRRTPGKRGPQWPHHQLQLRQDGARRICLRPINFSVNGVAGGAKLGPFYSECNVKQNDPVRKCQEPLSQHPYQKLFGAVQDNKF